MRQFTYMSDLHLEMEQSNDWSKIIPRGGDILLLAGDIGHPDDPKFKSFLDYVAKIFNQVVYVPGNHEYYNSSLARSDTKLRQLCQQCGVCFMNNNLLVIDGYANELPIVILGTTLWSYIPNQHYSLISQYLNDYRLIKDFTTAASSQLFLMNYSWLVNHINQFRKTHRVIVVTHHAPLLKQTSAPHYEGKPTNHGFASDCSEIMNLGVDYWVYGHTHYTTSFRCGNTLVMANQRGYHGKDRAFNPAAHFTIGGVEIENMMEE